MTNAWKIGLAVFAALILAGLGYFSFSDILKTSPIEESEKRTKFTILIQDQEDKSPLPDVNVFFSYLGGKLAKLSSGAI